MGLKIRRVEKQVRKLSAKLQDARIKEQMLRIEKKRLKEKIESAEADVEKLEWEFNLKRNELWSLRGQSLYMELKARKSLEKQGLLDDTIWDKDKLSDIDEEFDTLFNDFEGRMSPDEIV